MNGLLALCSLLFLSLLGGRFSRFSSGIFSRFLVAAIRFLDSHKNKLLFLWGLLGIEFIVWQCLPNDIVANVNHLGLGSLGSSEMTEIYLISTCDHNCHGKMTSIGLVLDFNLSSSSEQPIDKRRKCLGSMPRRFWPTSLRSPSRLSTGNPKIHIRIDIAVHQSSMSVR